MMSWEQLDKLNHIANDRTIPASQRKEAIASFMQMWGMLANETSSAWDFSPNSDNVTGYRQTPIDPARECVRARTPLTGQVGHTYSPGY